MKKNLRTSTKEKGNRNRFLSFLLSAVMFVALVFSAVAPGGADVTHAAGIPSGTLVVKNANEKSGMWDLPLMDYLYSTIKDGTVKNYVKYLDDDASNGWRLAYCTQFSTHFVDSAEYIAKTWQASGMYSEISWAIAHGSNKYGDKNDSGYSTGNWLKDYYVTQAVIYCILSDYGYDGHPVSSLRAVEGYQDVYDCTLAMYRDAKANAGTDGYGDCPFYKIIAPSSVKMVLSPDGSYYESGWYSIQSSGTVTSRSITLEDAPAGCEIVYENAGSLTSRFYIRIPVSKAHEMIVDEISFKVKASAVFERPYIYIYEAKAADYQNITFQQYEITGNGTGSEAVVSLSLEKCKIAVQKSDSETGNGVGGAQYGIYRDAACTDLAWAMPETDENGYTELSFVKRQDTYYVKEITASANYLLDTFVHRVNVSVRQTAVVDSEEKQVRGEIELYKIDSDTGSFTSQGDAVLTGAEYGLYAKEDICHPDGHTGILYPAGTLVKKQTIGTSGKTVFTDLYPGEYFVKEISAPVGYLLDETEYPVFLSGNGQDCEVITESVVVAENVIKQAFEIIKISSDGSSAEAALVEGAEFTVKLESDVEQNGWENAKVCDVLMTDEKGYARSSELPYGTYLVRETKTPAEVNTAKDFRVTVSEDSRIPQTWRVMNDAPFSAYIRLIKKDAESGEVIRLGGTAFKIRNAETGNDVAMKVGNRYVSTFVTDETGMVTTPLKLLPGYYVVYEIGAPEGYMVCEDEIPVTVTAGGGYEVDEDGDFLITVEMEDQPQYGNVTLYKHGEILSAAEKTGKWKDAVKSFLKKGNENCEFLYEDQPLEGCVFQVICDEDIYTADHQVDENGGRILAEYEGIKLEKGAVVAVLTTDEEGKAEVPGLPLGKYHIEEVKACDGFVLNKKQDSFELEYGGQDVEVVCHSSDYVNQRQKTALSLVKSSVDNGAAVQGAVYGIYAGQDLLTSDGDAVVREDELIEVQTTDAEGNISFEADLPLGCYYVKEIEAAPGYYLDEKTYNVDFTYQGQDVKIIEQTLEVQDVPIDKKVFPGIPQTGDNTKTKAFATVLGVSFLAACIIYAAGRRKRRSKD